jgi:hypothetical protein
MNKKYSLHSKTSEMDDKTTQDILGALERLKRRTDDRNFRDFP